MRSARAILLGREQPAVQRRDAHDREVAVSDLANRHRDRLADAGEVLACVADGRHHGEGFILIAPILVVGIGDGDRFRVLLEGFTDEQDAVRLLSRVGDRAEQHGMDHAEDRRIRPNAERDRQDRNDSEAGMPPHGAQGAPDILP